MGPKTKAFVTAFTVFGIFMVGIVMILVWLAKGAMFLFELLT